MAQNNKEHKGIATTASKLKSKEQNDKDNNNNNNNNTSNDPNTQNEEKIGSNDGISGNVIVATVKGFGVTDFKAIAKETGKTIEESLENSAKLFDILAKWQTLFVKCAGEGW